MYIPAYFIFFSALIVTIRSDIETMLISRYVTLCLIPIGILASYLELLPISTTESITSAVIAGGILWLIGQLFYLCTHRVGLGQGDIDLIAFIGSFTGLMGTWVTVMLGSILGTFFGLGLILTTGQKKSLPIPFGPFLAISAMVYVLYAPQIIIVLFGI